MFDLWIYRENVGWWLEEDGFDSVRDVAGHIETFFHEHRKSAELGKLQFAITPHKTPMAIPKWPH